MIIKLNNITNNIFKSSNIGVRGANRFTYPNLAPLEKDTVSFSARSELVASNMEDAPSVNMCMRVEENAEPANYYLKKVLDKYLKPIVQGQIVHSKADKFPVAKYKTRIKSATSIREKVVSKHGKLYRNEYNRFSSDVTDAILKHFKAREGVPVEEIFRVVKQEAKYNSSGTVKTSPYINVPYLVNEILNVLDSMTYIDFSSLSEREQKSAFMEIVDTVEGSYDSKLLNSDSRYVDPATVTGIKHYANDIVGARIVMMESAPEYTGKVLDAIKQAAADGYLKITSIENNIPSVDKLPEGKQLSDYEYATQAQLRSLAKKTGARLITNESKTGYLAVHINVDLSDDMFKEYGGVFNGYSGEIQIIGRDVEQLKDIEDLCYKLKDKKNAYKRVYEPFKKHFLTYYTKDTQEAFDDYTYALYLAQRALPPRKRASYRFPTIAELGFEGKVPPQLDFNRLKIKKRDCDADLAIQEAQAKKTEASSHDIIRNGNISTMKNLIDSKF